MAKRLLIYILVVILLCVIDSVMDGPFGGEEPLALALQLIVSMIGAAWIFICTWGDKKEGF